MARIFLLLLLCSCQLWSQKSAFNFQSFATTPEETPEGNYLEAEVDMTQFRAQLARAPKNLGAKGASIELPLPNGAFARFTAVDRPVFEASLAEKYPLIRSYVVDGPWGAGRVAISHKGVDALLLGPEGTFAIQPTEEKGRHLVFYSKDFSGGEETLALECGYNPADPLNLSGLEPNSKLGSTTTRKMDGEPRELYQYDLALTNTGEFARSVGGSKEDVLAAYNTAVSTINAIFEREVGVTMNLLAISEQLIYLDADSDPFSNADEGGGLLSQVITAFDIADIPSTAYDLGHLFTGRCVDVGGVVSGRACTGSKTRGVTCLSGSNVARTAERIMAHEIAHQFSVSHSWNNCPPNQEQRAGNTAFEPGSGTTIMSYAGSCGSQNIGSEQAYYHVGSLQQFLDYTREGGAGPCATIIETNNISPEITLDYENGFFIPKSTPFRLTGTATDANPGDTLTYNWDQYDLGPASDVRDPEGNAPLFRSVRPTTDGATRYFPRIDRVANNITNNIEEMLPDYGRDMTFRFVVRDNNEEAGAVEWETLRFKVAGDVGPLVVNEPDFGDSTAWRVGEYREVTWDVAGTNGFPVFTDRVNILLSGDGGLTFTETLASNVVNKGSAFINVPDTLGDAMRIIVAAADNIYFNMNVQDFSIREAVQPTFTLESDLRYTDVCLPETVTANFTAGSVLGFSAPITVALDTQSLPDGLVASFNNTQLVPGENTTLTLDLQNVTTSGRITVPITVSADGADTIRQEIVLDVVANDFSDLVLQTPDEGTTGIILTDTFDWTPSVNAEEYEIQIATSPSFAAGTIFETADELFETEYVPEEFFAANTVYYWRIRPYNSCGPGPWSDPASFRTVNSQCDIYASTDTPVTLPGSGGSFTRESILFVDRRGTINDLNLPNIIVNYQFASKITLTLTSPAGTSVVLYEEKCFSTNTINLGFDDDAPMEVACPPDDRRVFTPKGSLADFNGEDTFGEWKLVIAVSETNGSSGQIDRWNVEFCADVEASPVETIVNSQSEVKPLERTRINRSELEVDIQGFNTGEMYYILTRTPAYGELTLNDRMLMAGDTFTQADINGGRLIYENTDDEVDTDDFGFVVTSPGGAYLSVTYHDIFITEDAISATPQVNEVAASLRVFPNPTSGELSVRWEASGNRQILIELYDINGRKVIERGAQLTDGASTLNLSALPEGMYFLRVGGLATRRVLKH